MKKCLKIDLSLINSLENPDLHNLSTVAAGMFPVLLLHRESAGGALVQPGVGPGLHGPGQGLRLVDDRHLDGGEETRVVFDAFEAFALKTEIKVPVISDS